MAQTSDPHISFGEQGCPVVGSSVEESLRMSIMAGVDALRHFYVGETERLKNIIVSLKQKIVSLKEELESKNKEIEDLKARVLQLEGVSEKMEDCQQNESKNPKSKPSFRALITHREPERVMKWLKHKIEGNKGRYVAAVLIKALKQKLISDLPTKGQFVNAAFTEKDIWRGVSKYLDARRRNEMEAYAEAEIDPFPNGNDLYNSESSNLVPEN